MLRKYPYFRLQVHLLKGKDLLAMDRGGKKIALSIVKEYIQGTRFIVTNANSNDANTDGLNNDKIS